MKNNSQKDWLNIAIMSVGIIVGLLILYGLFTSLRSYNNNNGTDSNDRSSVVASTPGQIHQTCSTCITINENGKKLTLSRNEDLVIELPESLYPKAHFIVIANPSDSVKQDLTHEPVVKGDWQAHITSLKQGTAEIIVKSTLNTISDFHISLQVK